MRKKIYDIKPPKAKAAEKKLEKSLQEFFTDERSVRKTDSRKKPVSRKPFSQAQGKKVLDQLPVEKTTAKKKERSYARLAFIGGGVLVLALCAYLFFALPRATVAIWPVLGEEVVQKNVMADASSSMVDVTKLTIPAEHFEAEKSLSQEFPATGNASDEGKASGTITIFNKYDPPSSLTLKEGTRFISDSGAIFITTQKVVVPAAKKSGSKITPSSVQVQVQAAEGGESYNIPPSTFSVPGLKGTAYYFSIYGSSDKAMTGGYAGKVKKITSNDVQEARNVLENRMIEEVTKELREQISEEYILLDGAVATTTTIDTSKIAVGSVAENFTVSGSIKAKALAFKKADLDEFVKEYLVSRLEEGETLIDSSISQEHSLFDADVAGGEVEIGVNATAKTYMDIDKNALGRSLLGKNETQMKETVETMMGSTVEKVEVKLWPFWVKTAPNNQKSVRIDLRFE